MNNTRRGFDLGPVRFSGLYLWAAFILVYSIWIPHLFLTGATVHSIASESAISGMLALAVLVPLAGGAFDLSIGAVINLSAVLVSQLQSVDHWAMWPAIAVSILATGAIGAVTGFIVVRLHVNSFIATLGMATVVAAVQEIVTGQSQPYPPTSKSWSELTQYEIGGFQSVFFYMIILALILWWALECTPAGRYVRATGANPDAARLSGVRTGACTFGVLVTSATISGVAGVFYASQSGPSLTFGNALLLPAFAAVFFGSTQLRPGHYNVWGTLLAVYTLATGVKGLQLVTGAQWLNDMFNGVALIAAVALAMWRQHAAAARRFVAREQEEPVLVGSRAAWSSDHR
jgi:ribose transport system permease protein